MESFAKSEKPVIIPDFNQYHNNSECTKPDVKAITNCRKKLDFTNDTPFKINKHFKKTESSYDLDNKETLVGKRSQIPRVPSNTKRNARERKRVRTINDYFSQLQKYLPYSKSSGQFSNGTGLPIVSNNNKKLSKVETLKAAIDYIEYLQTFSPPETQVYSKKNHNLNIVSSSNSPYSACSNSSSLLSSPASSTSSSSSSMNKIYKPKNSHVAPVSPNSKGSFIQSPQNKMNAQSPSNRAPSSIAIVANSSNVTFKATLSTSQTQQPNSATFTISSNPSTVSHREQFEASNICSSAPYSTLNPQPINNSSSNNNILNPIDFNINYNNNPYTVKDSYYYNQSYGSNYYSNEHYSQKPYQAQAEFYQSGSNSSYYGNMAHGEQSTCEPSIYTPYSTIYSNNYNSTSSSLDQGQQFINRQSSPLHNETKPQYFLTTDTNNISNIPNGNMTIEY